MTMTPEERAEINRRNARKARGPITERGKARSRQNAIKHGLRAEIVALPQEDAEVVRGRQQAWQDYYRPESPAAQHLVDQCVRATLMADRCDAYHAAAVAKRVRQAEDCWENERADEVTRLAAMFPDDPAHSVRLLSRSGHGCRWLIARWERLGVLLDGPDGWNFNDRDEAIRLLGQVPDPPVDRPRLSPEAFLIHLFIYASQKARGEKNAEAWIDRLFHPGRVPHILRPIYRRDALPDSLHFRAIVKGIVAERLEVLRVEEERLRREIDEPDRAEAADRVAILPESGGGQLFLRYHAEARSAFHRAFREMSRVVEHDKEGPSGRPARNPVTLRLAATGTEPGPGPEVEPGAGAGPEVEGPRPDQAGPDGARVGDPAVSPNEPKPDATAVARVVDEVVARDLPPTAPAVDPRDETGSPQVGPTPLPSPSPSPSVPAISPNEPKSRGPKGPSDWDPSKASVHELLERVAAGRPGEVAGLPWVLEVGQGGYRSRRDAGDVARGRRVGEATGGAGGAPERGASGVADSPDLG